jgi:hypothetical protein
MAMMRKHPAEAAPWWVWAGLTVLLGIAFSLVVSGQIAPINAGRDGTGLAVWQARGSAAWRVEQGHIVAKVLPGGGGGWLWSDRSYQDLGVKFSFRCRGECRTGILLGAEKSGAHTKGLYIALEPGDVSAYEMTLGANADEVARTKLAPAAVRDSAGAGGGGGRQGGAPLTAPAGHPMSQPREGGIVRLNDWNEVEVRLFTPARGNGTALNVVLNGVAVATGYPAPEIGPHFGQQDRIALRTQFGRFGHVGLRVDGAAGDEVRYRDVSILSYTEIIPTVDKFSNRFRVQVITPYFHGDGSCVSDVNRDGSLDIFAGLMVWLGPDFKTGRTLDHTYPLDASDYGSTLSCQTADFTGDGWPDVLVKAFTGGSPVYLYVNPKNELRRWPRYEVINLNGPSENNLFADIDGDNRPEFIIGGDGSAVNYAKPDPADPTRPWIIHKLTEQAAWGPHGIGVGDVNGDGRLDVLRGWGWWEQPATLTGKPWAFHPEEFGRAGQGAGGGAQMHVYDVNGDRLNDVITSLEAHGYGLAWFEQKRDSTGKISFVRHMIMDRDPSMSHGVVFTEMHGLDVADVDGDGLKDIVTGKFRDHNLGNFHYSYAWPSDEDAENVFYWFKLVRKPGGGVDFEPRLIHNNSGVGRQPLVLDMNADGVTDIVNNGRFGTWIFYGNKGAVD